MITKKLIMRKTNMKIFYTVKELYDYCITQDFKAVDRKGNIVDLHTFKDNIFTEKVQVRY